MKKTSKQTLKRFAIWHTPGEPEFIEGYRATIKTNPLIITIDQGPNKTRVITGAVMFTEVSPSVTFK